MVQLKAAIMKNLFKHFSLSILTIFTVLSLAVSCDKDEMIPITPPEEELLVPTVSTTEVTDITNNSAASGGTVDNNGGAQITASGVCWSLEATPLLFNYKTDDGANQTTFTSSMVELSPETTYYYRAYAISSAGIGYGPVISFTTQPAP